MAEKIAFWIILCLLVLIYLSNFAGVQTALNAFIGSIIH